MDRILIVGAGGFGREVLEYLRQIRKPDADWEVGGFLDDNPHALDGLEVGVPVLQEVGDYAPATDDRLVMALGDPSIKLEIGESLLARGASFISVIHHSALVGSRVEVGAGCVICPMAVVTCDIRLGAFVALNVHSCIGHDAVLGDGVTISPHSDVNGHGRLGRGVFMGSGARVLPGVEVGDFAKIGAGAVVHRTVDAGMTVIGVPARPLARANA